MDSDAPILFYDGVCGLCNGAVRFVLRHDRSGRIRFAALQSPFAAEVLGRHGRDPGRLDTMYLLLNGGAAGERLLDKSDGILALLGELGGIWALLGLTRALPRGLRDRGYDWVARNRYRWFGRYDQCLVPPPAVRRRFVDRSEAAPPGRATVG